MIMGGIYMFACATALRAAIASIQKSLLTTELTHLLDVTLTATIFFSGGKIAHG
jgi:hypothetical protein